MQSLRETMKEPRDAAVISGVAVAFLLGMSLIIGIQRRYFWPALLFILLTSGGVAAGTYRRARSNKDGIDPAPPLVSSVPGDMLLWSLILGVFGFAWTFLVRQPGEEYKSVWRMTVFFMLMGAVTTYLQRRWPKRPWWYDAVGALAVLITTTAIWLVVRAVS